MSSIKSVGPSIAPRISAEPKASIVAGGSGCIPQKPFPGKPFPPSFPPPFPGKPLPPIFPGRGDAHARTQGNQLHDIADGVRNGSITAQESEKLLAQQQKLAQATQAAKADGKVTLAEQLKLSMMERQADRAIDSATNNRERDFFTGGNAQRQADQIDRIANGRTNGNITHSEASKLLGQQVGIADARGDADTKLESFMLGQELNQADRDITLHSRPGTQFGGFDPLPLPIKPRPLPIRPEPMPVPLHRMADIAG
jgi:hypothetical protein